MKLRPRDSRFPINDKGKEPMREDEEDSDDEEINALPSFESDYDSDSDKGEENEGQVPDLNLDPKPALVVNENNSEEVDQDQEELLDIDIDMEQDIEDLIEEEEFLEVEVENSKKRKRKSKKDKPTLLWQVWQEENERWIQENLDKNLENENQNEVIPETVETPSDMIMPLLRYQKEWLAWALKQEESDSRGGILADEMGMGKTVQAIALVCAKRELKNAISGTILPSCGACPSTSTELPSIKATLVICPLVAVLQWQKEIERFTKKGSNKVLVYHGANRAKKFNKFSDYDFVITTYSTIEAEYRKNVMPPKKKCEWCAKPLYEDKMAVHLKYFCGPNATRTISQAKQRKRKAVKVKTGVKSSKQEVTKKRRPRKSKKSAKDNTETENGETNENEGDFEEDLPIKQQSNLHAVKWERIILDEAHYIKDRRSNTTKAVLALISNYKWALSGTPLQNRVGELYSLVRFLQIVPYSYYFCKDCDCRVLDYGVTDCPSCPHKCVRHFCWWNKYIASPIQAHWNNSIGKGAMLLLKEKLLKSIVLRRTKKGRAADLALPPRIVTLRRDSFDITEEDYYTSLYNETQAEFDTYVNEGTLMNNYAHIFDLLTRLRQAVDHPYLVVYSNVAIAKAAARMISTEPQQICGICDDVVEDVVVTSCGHPFCKTCLMEFCASGEQVSCPTCSKPLTVDFSGEQSNVNAKTSVKGYRASSILNRIQLDNFQSSTKIEALREEIRLMSERDGAAKGIVFSQFTSFLDLIHYSLQKSGIKCVSLVGSMTMNARDVAIKKFIEDSECKVFLMSLKAGGVALNLTVASHVFLMDPWWNPAVERQAQDRIHRIGQYKPIKTVRFVIENTVEERILKLQQKKELVFEGTVGGSVEALGKLTEADLKFLFC